jgi:hypothetical protein
MQILGFSLQRLAGLQAAAASESKAIKKYHWSSLLRIGLFALFSNTTSALAMMSTAPPPPIPLPLHPYQLEIECNCFLFSASCGVAPETWFAAFVQQRDAFGPSHKGRT